MSPDRAKEILTAWPPERQCLDDEVREALKLVETDSGLRQWWENEQNFDSAVKEALLRLEPCEKAVNDTVKLVLSQSASSQKKTVAFQKYAKWVLGAAALFMVALIAVQLFSGTSDDLPKTAESFRRMAVDMVWERRIGTLGFTNGELGANKQWLANHGGPVSERDDQFDLAQREMELEGLGCVILAFNEESVSVICMECKEGRRHHLFSIAREVFESTPHGSIHEVLRDLSLQHRIWSDSENFHVLVSENKY